MIEKATNIFTKKRIEILLSSSHELDYHRFVRNRLTRKRGKTRIREKITEIVSIVETDRTLIRKRFHDVKDIMLGLDEYEKTCETTTTTSLLLSIRLS